MSPFWATVVKVELTDIVFAIDSILVAVAVSDKLWVVITGGILGIVMMRLVIGRLLSLIRRYPVLVDGAFVIIAWVGIKLLLEYGHSLGYVHFEIPKWFSLGLIVVIFGASYVYARRRGPVEETEPDISPGALTPPGPQPAAPKRSADRALALAASISRLRGSALVTRSSMSRRATPATSSTARSNTGWLAFDGAVNPLSLRTNWTDAARISASVAGGSKLKSVRMFRHMGPVYSSMRRSGQDRFRGRR